MTDIHAAMHDTLHELKRLARVGVYFDADAVQRGISVASGRVTLAALEVVVSEIPDERTRAMTQARLGLGNYRSAPVRDRNEDFAAAFSVGTHYKQLSRVQQDAPLAALAALLAGAATPVATTSATAAAPIGDYDRWEVLEYHERRIFPAEAGGQGMSVNRRTVRFLVADLHEYRMTQVVTWRSGHLPSYVMTSPGTVRIENQQAITQGDEPGYRFDLVFQLPASPDASATFGWVRLYQHGPDDFVAGEVGTVELTPNALVREATFVLQFPDDRGPAGTWSFDRVPALYRLNPPEQFRTTLSPTNGEVMATFQELRPGYSFGIGWVW